MAEEDRKDEEEEWETERHIIGKGKISKKKRVVERVPDMMRDPFYDQYGGNIGSNSLNQSMRDYSEWQSQMKKGNVEFKEEEQEVILNAPTSLMVNDNSDDRPNIKYFINLYESSLEIWYKIDNSYLDIIYKTLKNEDFRKYTYDFFSDLFKINFNRVLNQGEKIREENLSIMVNFLNDTFTLEFLYNLYRKTTGLNSSTEVYLQFSEKIIPYKLFLGSRSQHEFFPLKMNGLIAELIGIFLGDGDILILERSDGGIEHRVSITLNKVDEERYVDYVSKILDKIFGHGVFREVSASPSQKGVHLICNRIDIVYKIVQLGYRNRDFKKGLISGDKIENQVGIPDIIFSNKEYIIRCLKSLFDTDGSLSFSGGIKLNLNLEFTSYSNTLLEDFDNSCKKLGLNPTKLIPNKNVIFTNLLEIKKFLNLIQPEKIKEPFRRLWFSLWLVMKYSYNAIYYHIRDRIETWKRNSGREIFNYSKDRAILLKSWLEDYYTTYLNHYIKEGFPIDDYLKENQGIAEFLISGRFTMTDTFVDYLVENLLTSDIKNKVKLEKESVKEMKSEIRDLAGIFLYQMIRFKPLMNDEDLLNYLINKYIRESLFDLFNLFKFPQYNLSLKNYLTEFIFIIRNIKELVDSQKSISGHLLIKFIESKGLTSPWGRKPIDSIIKALRGDGLI